MTPRAIGICSHCGAAVPAYYGIARQHNVPGKALVVCPGSGKRVQS